MIEPFVDNTAFYFTIDDESIGDEVIDVYVDGHIHDYDRVHILLLGGQIPVVIGMYAAIDGDEETFVPVDIYPLQQVERIENPTSDVERIGR